ncbi:hypothetical protein FQN60_002878 [Etheostoma spectabile]|uniref:Uncharacterized protein n=1 Tax=Etheostoma spectabile TaxID=54343 RepID=A0A5J5CHU3_9PERO|nr:hypothetical protein FQN60_002878 [Etheostoma spectabile]
MGGDHSGALSHCCNQQADGLHSVFRATTRRRTRAAHVFKSSHTMAPVLKPGSWSGRK